MNSGFLRSQLRLTAVVYLVLLGGCASVYDDDADFTGMSTWPDTTVTPAPTSLPVAAAVVHHGPRDVKRVALTFDACSTSRPSRYDERITKILVEMNVPATIFLGGKWMEDHPAHTRYLASLPQFELANHSYLHPHMTKVSEERARAELRWTQELMFTLVGHAATLFRAPYGEIDERVVRLAAEAGLVTVQFDLASGDADKKASKKKLVGYVTTKTRNGSIVVMHINRRGWHTAEALPDIVTKLRQRGFEFVTVSQLLAIQNEIAAPAQRTDTPPDSNPPNTPLNDTPSLTMPIEPAQTY